MTRRVLKIAEVTKVDQLGEVGRRSTNPPAQGRAPMTAALVESLRRSAGADPSPEGAVKLPLYKQFVRSRRERERVSLLPAAGGDGTEDWWIAAITAANSASLSRDGHLGFRGALKRAAPTRLTRAASAAVGPPGANSPRFPRGVSGFSMIRIRWRFLSVTRRLNLARGARMSPEGTPVTRILICRRPRGGSLRLACNPRSA